MFFLLTLFMMSMLFFLFYLSDLSNIIENSYVSEFILGLGLLITILLVLVLNRRKYNGIFLEQNNEYNKKFILITIILIITFQIGISMPIIRFIEMNFMPFTTRNSVEEIKSLAIGSLFIAPLFEEIIFRGIILRGLLTKNSPKNAIFYTTILFVLFHVSLVTLVSLFVLGFIFNYTYYKIKNIFVTMFLHFIANLSALFSMYLTINNDLSKGIQNLYGVYTLYLIIPLWIITIVSFLYSLKLSKGI
jgi:membrane protease YdiL (CAAX protease family)